MTLKSDEKNKTSSKIKTGGPKVHQTPYFFEMLTAKETEKIIPDII